ncbi:hypothetical protein V8C37DRAFT_389015 [Trichoderma ceciliae]
MFTLKLILFASLTPRLSLTNCKDNSSVAREAILYISVVDYLAFLPKVLIAIHESLFGLLVRHTLTPSGIVGVLTVLREAFKCGHEAGALKNYYQQVYSVGLGLGLELGRAR